MSLKLTTAEMGRMSVDEYHQADKLPLVVVLDNVRSQHNVGAVFRTADAMRIARVVLCGICCTPPNQEIHKTALGAEESVDWQYYPTTLDCINQLKEDGYRICSIEQVHDSVALQDFVVNNEQKTAIVLGNEVKGVSQQVVDASDLCIEIPQQGTKHSLNISCCAAIVMWHVYQSNI